MKNSSIGPLRINTTLSERQSAEIAKVIPGGVNSPFRSFCEVGGHTIFFSKAKGSRLYDIDGNEYIDYLGAWGPAILGHSPNQVIAACQKTLSDGPVFGSPHQLELEFAQRVIAAVPSLAMVRFVNSGTEAVMSAVRLARGFTGKDVVIMFAGGYHGHSDSTLASNGHRASDGIPSGTASNTVLACFNDLVSLEDCLRLHKGQTAAVLIEPVPGSMGVIAPQPGFLAGVRSLCDQYDCLLIFDEVLTGFRLALGGAQSLFGVTPDLSCFGKALGGGMPIGAYGGRAEIMEHLQPLGSVYQAGTFSGNPVTMAGGIEILKLLNHPEVYETLEERSRQLFGGLQETVDRYGWPIQLQRVGSMFAVLFSAVAVTNFEDSKQINAEQFALFFHYLLDNGIYLPPSSVDAACVSAAHTAEEVSHTIAVCNEALKRVFK
jgi:glutamate-1-semialdehyde 2,1-aminomutase